MKQEIYNEIYLLIVVFKIMVPLRTPSMMEGLCIISKEGNTIPFYHTIKNIFTRYTEIMIQSLFHSLHHNYSFD